LGNLFVRIPFDIVKEQDLPVPLRESSNGALKMEALPGLGVSPHRFPKLVPRRSFVGRAADLFSATVYDDANQPCREAGLPPEGRQTLRCAEPGILDDISGSVGIGHHAIGNPIEKWRVSAVEHAERRLVAVLAKALCQRAFVSRCSFRH
jgi:hypothetical protein